jgi:thymidylate synthase (FAD)
MPVNNNLKQCGFPMNVRFDEKPTTVFKNNLDSIKVTLLDHPDQENAINYMSMFLDATWVDTPAESANMSKDKKIQYLKDCIAGKALPTALETMQFTFLIEGISLQEVTHILRTRTASFSADCSADKWWTHKAALVPNAIQNSPELYERYKKLVEETKQLYCDIIDSRQISIMDARYILPRCLETFYYMSIDFKNLVSFLHQRFDRQIQPETDNVLAYKMYDELITAMPIFKGLIDIDEVPRHWVATSRTGKCTNLYKPEENADVIEYNENDFIYNVKRSELNGTNPGATNKFTQYYNHYKKKFSE